tara:strand:- start:847 stop:3123 length:2277 start_codon:yes stop_codon:yes gene_type:complete
MTKFLALTFSLLMVTVSLAGCLGGDSDEEELDFDEIYFDHRDVDLEITHDGSNYEITIQLNYSAAPIHSENFAVHVEEGHYDGTIFHRIIDNFMIQGGDYTNSDGTGGNAASFYDYCNGQASDDPSCNGEGQSAWTIPDEADNGLIHSHCVVSMAKTGQPNTGGSQFFIVPQDSWPNHLDGVHTVFGLVTSGCEHVTSISEVPTAAQDRPVNDVVIESATIGDFYEEMVLVPRLDDVEQEVFVCSEIEYTTHEVTISFVDYEFETWQELNPQHRFLYIENSDLIYFEDATQVLANGQIYHLHNQGAPVLDTHTKFYVFSNTDNQDAVIITNKGDVVCLIENPNISNYQGELGRECAYDSHRLENGSYEHASPMCNHVLTEHLDHTSTIRGGIEFPRCPDDDNHGTDNGRCANVLPFFNVHNGSGVGVNYTVASSWGHFLEGNQFTIHYNNQDGGYHKSYFVKELTEERKGGQILSKGITTDNIEGYGVAYVELYADENLTELASLDRDLTTNDEWEVIANECSFYRSNFFLGTSKMPKTHHCAGMYKGVDIDWYTTNYPDFDIDAYLDEINNPKENPHSFFHNFTQAMITKNYSAWHGMLADEVHAVNSNATYDKANLTEAFFENFTNVLGTIELENASRLDLAQSHWQLDQYPPLNPDPNYTFNWGFDVNTVASIAWDVTSPMTESALLQDRIYNSTGWGYGGTFIESTEYGIMTWIPGPNTTPLFSEYLLTIVVDRDVDGNLSIVGIADYNVEIIR